MQITVRRGDSLWNYSRWFQIPQQLIVDSNPGVNTQQLQVGQHIQIPGYVTAEVVIRHGDTLWDIAKQRGIPLEGIYALNPDISSGLLQNGQRIKVPVRVTWQLVNPKRSYSYEELQQDIALLRQAYPFVRLSTIGHSVQGRSLQELRVGNGARRVHMNGSVHANEWITTPVLMQQLDQYLQAVVAGGELQGQAMLPLYEQTELSLVPQVNPDGVQLVLGGIAESDPRYKEVLAINSGSEDFSGWKANIRGVDLNDQFPALWEREAERQRKEPSPRDYPGTAPLTEPESQALAKLTRSSDFARALSYHTQGSVIYWGFQGLQPPESAVLAETFAHTSGYEAIENVDSYAGYKDWFIQDWRRPGFTIELGKGSNPLPISQLDQIAEETLGIFVAALQAY